MLKSLEWSLLLYVREVVVPFKFRYQRYPLRAERKKWKESKGGHDLRAYARKRVVFRIGLLSTGDSRRGHKSQRREFGSSLARHDAGQIVRICKKQEDLFSQIGRASCR